MSNTGSAPGSWPCNTQTYFNHKLHTLTYDKQLEAIFSVVKILSVAAAEQLAAEKEVVCCSQKLKKYTEHYMLPTTSNKESEEYKEEKLNLSKMKKEEKLMAALINLKTRRVSTVN